MNEKKIKILFIAIFLCMIIVPFVFATRSGSRISEEENRTLNAKPKLIEDSGINLRYTYDYEEWFKDNLGFRNELTNLYARMQYYVFNNIFDEKWYIGKTGDLIYANDKILESYQRLNLYTEKEKEDIINSYKVVNDWLTEQGIQFFYVQCYDKQTIYPERFMNYVNQMCEMSRTDQIVQNLQAETDINVVSLKEVLLANKDSYDVFSRYGDPTHWSERGAFICYQEIMRAINAANSNRFMVLEEDDYCIQVSDIGNTLKGNIHFEEYQEVFTVKNPRGYQADSALLEKYGEDERSSVWINPEADNDVTLLIVGDSYVEGYLLDSFAESFSKMYMVHGDFTTEMQEMVEICEPDIVIYECAERVNRNKVISELAKKIVQKKISYITPK